MVIVPLLLGKELGTQPEGCGYQQKKLLYA